MLTDETIPKYLFKMTELAIITNTHLEENELECTLLVSKLENTNNYHDNLESCNTVLVLQEQFPGCPSHWDEQHVNVRLDLEMWLSIKTLCTVCFNIAKANKKAGFAFYD